MPPLLTLTTAYRRSAFPRLGLTFEQVMAAPALRGVLELAERIHARTAHAAARTGAGRFVERSAL